MSDPIPKFLSFKPKPKKQEPSISSESRSEPLRDHSKHSREHDDHLQRARRTRPRSPKAPRNQDIDAVKPRSPKGDTRPLAKSNSTYTLDSSGDIGNLKYGSLHKYDIPQYYRTGYGHVLGLANSLKIDRDQTTQSRIFLQHGHSHDDTRKRQFLHDRNLGKIRPKKVRIENDSGAFGTDQPFIPLSRSCKRKRTSASPKQTSVDYRQLDFDRAARPEDKTDDSALDSDSSEDNSDQDDGAVARLHNAELTRQTREDASNANAWASLIHHQAELVAPGVEPTSLSTTQRRAVSEMRLALYEKANKAVHLSARPAFIRAMLDEGSNLWSASTQLTKWEEAVIQNPSDILLWRQFLDLVQNSEQGAEWEKTKLCFVNLLRRLQSLIMTTSDKDTTKNLKQAQIYIILRLTSLMNGMGYQETSVAIWQAIVDLHIVKAQQEVLPDRRVKLIEQQWDDEEYRFGEKEGHYSAGLLPPTKPSAGLTESDFEGNGAYTTFARRERHLSTIMELPGKTTDELDDGAPQDAMHVVFFSDIADILEATKMGLGSEGVIDALLCFCGLPSIISRDGTLWPWRDDSTLARMSAQDRPVTTEPTSEAPLLPRRYVTTSDILWREDCFPVSLKRDRPQTIAFINTGLQQLIDMNDSNSELRIYWLAFQATYYPELAPKTAKKLIKSCPSDLHLYNAAANIEARLNRFDKADRIWSTAIKMAANFDPTSAEAQSQHNHDFLELAYTWSISALERGDPSLALSHLFSIRPSTSLPPSSSTLLSFSQDLQSSSNLAAHHHLPHTAALSISTLALLTYLTSSFSLSPALTVLTTQQPASPLLTELLLQFSTRLITHHLTLSLPHRPASLLTHLTQALISFPANTLLLSLHARLTHHTHLLTTLSARDAPAPSASSQIWPWAYALARATARYVVLGPGSGAAEAVRALFRIATGDGSQVRHCAGLWEEWLGFELRVLREVEERYTAWGKGTKGKRGERRDERAVQWGRVRAVYFAGLRALPWEKEWVLRGLEVFERQGGMEAELKGLYGVLLERDMRVRVEMED